MVAKPGPEQASFNAGELAPELHRRTDVKQWYAGLALARNVEPVPQGGARISPRSRHLGRIRRAMLPVAATVTATALGPHETAAIIKQIAFDDPADIAEVTLDGFSADHAVDGLLQMDWHDGLTWRNFGSPFSAATVDRIHMVAQPPGTQVAAAHAIRLRLTAPLDVPTSFALSDMAAYAESDDLAGVVRLKPFTAGDDAYVGVFTDGNADMWRDGVYAGGTRSGVLEAEIAAVDAVQREETMLLFHDRVATRRILRVADDEWPSDLAPFDAIPQVDLGGSYENSVVDAWDIYLRFPTTGGFAGGKELTIVLNVNGEETVGVVTADPPDWTATAAAIKAAIEALPSVGTGITVTPDSSGEGAGSVTFGVSFDGEDNESAAFSLTAQVVNTGEAAATTAHTTVGKAGGEPLIGPSAGYAAAGVFYQDRLLSGGFASKKSALLASSTGEYFNLNTEIAAASGAVLDNLDTEGSEQIVKLVRAAHLVIFTDKAEYFLSNRALSRTDQRNYVECSRNGALRGVPVVEHGGRLIYVATDKEDDERKGVLLYAMAYDDVAQKYVSEPVSMLAPHIATDIVDMALQKFGNPTVADRLWMVRADGTMTLAIMLNSQDVLAFVRWHTAGAVKALCVDGKNRIHIAVERAVGNATELHLERLETGLLFDATVTVTNSPPAAGVAGLEIHEGAQVWAKADGHVVGPFTVTAGAITLPFAAATIDVGRWTAPLARLLPLSEEVAERVVLKRPKRVHTVKVELIGTTSIAIAANGEAADDQPLYRAGAPTDAPVTPFTGLLEVTGLVGFSDDGAVEITQTKPGALQWRSVMREARR